MDKFNTAIQFSMIGHERLLNFMHQIDYVLLNNIPGCIVECGVWKGGAVCMAKAFLKERKSEKKVYAFDSFEGLPQPAKEDFLISTGQHASLICGVPDDPNNNCIVSIEDFKNTMNALGLDSDDIIIKKGWFEETTKDFHEPISILRFDGDWYKSTMDVLDNLYSKVTKGGVLIFDDYGYWNGNKQAVDEFIKKNKLTPIINFTDEAESWFIKQ